MRISVLGAGAWGTALAIAAARRHEVSLWARDAAQAQAMAQARCNTRYLPGHTFPEALRPVADPGGPLADVGTELWIIATPMAALRASLGRLAALQASASERPQTCFPLVVRPPEGVKKTGGGPAFSREPLQVLWLCKGFEAGSGLLGHQIAAEVLPGARCGVLSGPSFAQEVAAGLPTALVAASADAGLTQMAVAAFHGGALRVYMSADPIGVEVGGAVKNVLAIATGIADGLGLGLNARAALITRGLAEMARLGLAMGARAETFMGLTGLGDLVLTATGDLSRNRKVGLALAEGLSLSAAVERLGHVAEGVYSAATVVARARALGVEMPLSEAVHAVLQGHCTPAQAVDQLMHRDARAEGV